MKYNTTQPSNEKISRSSILSRSLSHSLINKSNIKNNNNSDCYCTKYLKLEHALLYAHANQNSHTQTKIEQIPLLPKPSEMTTYGVVQKPAQDQRYRIIALTAKPTKAPISLIVFPSRRPRITRAPRYVNMLVCQNTAYSEMTYQQ